MSFCVFMCYLYSSLKFSKKFYVILIRFSCKIYLSPLPHTVSDWLFLVYGNDVDLYILILFLVIILNWNINIGNKYRIVHKLFKCIAWLSQNEFVCVNYYPDQGTSFAGSQKTTCFLLPPKSLLLWLQTEWNNLAWFWTWYKFSYAVYSLCVWLLLPKKYVVAV